MSDSEGSYYQPTIERKTKTGRKPTENKRKSKSDRPSKKAASDSDIFGISHDHEAGADVGSSGRACLPSLFVYRVANGCERRTAHTNGEYYIDCKVYRANDARNTDSLELWKKAIVRIKLQTDIDSPQWQKLQEFVKSADVLFPDKPIFYDNK
ncbi:uncharacterized protein LOC118273196 [Spodoptera frugiperda]|uniref:Uncharacterized protein LOC118273196 n=1 Tax=Spodoptera frugiperda TaxID=7108 RepID=A0A9R0EZI7_SPOFR|nr:uncharacterized protein LOC118273196 [Spodoptera frugiperda]